jgi:hypothetical protein
MAASLVSHNARPQAPGEHLSVVLIPKVAGDLRRLRRRTRLSTTDLTNRAITSYDFFDLQLRAGRDVIVRDNGTGETRLVRFLTAPAGQVRRARPRLFRWGRRASADARWRRRAPADTRWPAGCSPASAGELGWPAHDRQDSLPLAGLVGQEAGRAS